jgi:PncC family amidohydrolase
MTGVDPEFLRAHGAVSAEAVLAMARGIRGLAGVDFAVAESGIAGPVGSRRSPKPVGTVVIAAVGEGKDLVHEHVFPGSRYEVMEQIAAAALALIYDVIRA